MNAFEDAVLGILSSCAGKDELITYLERMISRDKEFYHLYPRLPGEIITTAMLPM